MNSNPLQHAWDRHYGAFTLIEVVLAMAIATGILAVVLYFYKQSELLRTQLIQESARVSAARLILDRLTSELAVAQRCESYQQGLAGGADNLHFVKLEWPGPANWTNRLVSTSSVPISPFRLINYEFLQSTNTNQVMGLVRTEESLSKKKAEPVVEGDVMAETNAPARPNPIPVKQLQFVRFRYWNGTSWQDSWSGNNLPAGVEVSLGVEALPEGLLPDEYPYELYRRVIYLPNHGPGQPSTNLDSAIKEGGA